MIRSSVKLIGPLFMGAATAELVIVTVTNKTAQRELDGIVTMEKMCQDTGYMTSTQLSSMYTAMLSTTITILELGTAIIN